MKIELTKQEIAKAIAEYIYNNVGKEVIMENIMIESTIQHNSLKDYKFICETKE